MSIIFAHRLRPVGLLCWCWLLAASAQPAAAQLTLKLSLLDEQVVREQPGLSGAAGLEKKTIRLGEPVSVRFELTNDGDGPVELIPSLNPSVTTGLYLVGQGGKAEPVSALRWALREVFVPHSSLPPRARIAYEATLFGKLLERAELAYLFPAPGEYELFAQYSVHAREGSAKPVLELESNRVRVTVGPPLPGWDELKAAGIVEEMEGSSRSDEEEAARRVRLRSIMERLPADASLNWLTSRLAPDETQEPRASAEMTAAPPPVDAKTRAEVEAALRAFLAALAAGRAETYAKFMSEDFLYNGSMNKGRTLQKMGEDVRKLRDAGSGIRAEFVSATAEGEDAVVTARLTFRTHSSSEERLFRFTMRKQKDAWLIRRWDPLPRAGQ